MRFRRSIKILPGLKINIGKTGINSISLFKRGASLTMGSKGSFLNLGLPGTGLSHRIRLDKPTKKRTKKEDKIALESAPLCFAQNCVESQSYTNPKYFQNSLDEKPNFAERDEENELQTFAYNDALTQHRKIKTPPRNPKDAYKGFFSHKPAFPIISLILSALSLSGFIYSLFFKENIPLAIISGLLFLLGIILIRRGFSLRRECNIDNKRTNMLIGHALSGHFTAMEEIFCNILKQMDWVLETSASFEISHDGKSMSVDVNLPEIQDLEKGPRAQKQTFAGSNVSPNKTGKLERDYQLLVHSIILRIAGEVFYYFPTVKNVLVSGFTDRIDPRTGLMRSDYIISVNFDRRLWLTINPALSDPFECIGLFNARRDCENHSSMKVIEPFMVESCASSI
ncbi:MAG: DUF4236 domain-containing protein [Deltaproteobacteria bacterium]|jgi:hypothetical protein|nr:DUF4236 domain-containing protein [Deltaproteobacteria bacterium]